MKYLISILFSVLSFAALAQPGSATYGVYKSRVNDTTAAAHTDGIAAAIAAGYAYEFWNNQAATPHWDVYTDSGVQHIFTYGAGGGGGGTPGGSDTQVQFNNSSAFGGDSDFTFTGGNTLNVDFAIVDTEAYDASGWNADNSVPTKDAVRDKIETLIAFTPTALTDGSSIALTATKHTLTTDEATITFSYTYTGDKIIIEVTLNAVDAIYTFPSGTLCVTEGIATGDNTMEISGVSGDKYMIEIEKMGSNYYVTSKRFGQ